VGATRRVTLKEAAEVLGISKEAVRKRVVRGTLRSDTGGDGRRYVYLDAGGDEPPTHERDELISQLRDENAYLRDENRRKDEIIMQQAMTMRQLTARQEEPRASPETVEEAPEATEPQSDAAGPQTPPQRPQRFTLRGLGRRIFGGS
jgi:hypothetical protein